jgi:hypothetical protein
MDNEKQTKESLKESLDDFMGYEKQTKESLRQSLDDLISIYGQLPEAAKYSYVNHSEIESLLLLIKAWFDAD